MGGERSVALTARFRARSPRSESASCGAGIPGTSVSLRSGNAQVGVFRDGVYQLTAGACGRPDHDCKGMPHRPLPHEEAAVLVKPARSPALLPLQQVASGGRLPHEASCDKQTRENGPRDVKDTAHLVLVPRL